MFMLKHIKKKDRQNKHNNHDITMYTVQDKLNNRPNCTGFTCRRLCVEPVQQAAKPMATASWQQSSPLLGSTDPGRAGASPSIRDRMTQRWTD